MKNEKPTLNYLLLVTFKTNLPYKTNQMAIPVGIEPTFFCVTGRRRNHWTTEPNGRESGIRTPVNGFGDHDASHYTNSLEKRYLYKVKR